MDVIQNKMAIGIDLGTTYSCVGAWVGNGIQIIPNELGNKTTPSCVSFTETTRLIGDSALNMYGKNPSNTIFDVKRLIGRKFSDPIVQQDIKLWPFKVEQGEENKPMIVVQFKGETKQFSPQEISSMILSKMRESAESFLQHPMQNAVLSVPAYFNMSQRQATKDAGTIAGLKVMRIINEPTAAAIAYSFNNKSKEERNILIYDLGGGTFDVAILTIEQDIIEAKATAGDTHLGGQDFDTRLLEYCIKDFYEKSKIDIKNNPKALRRLRTQCEKAKRILSSSVQTTIQVDSLADSIDYSISISRARFQQLCLSLFKQTMTHVEKAIEDSGILKDQIHEIVLVGGSSRIPKISELLRQFFNGKQPNRSINPDQAVAYGAAVQASILSGGEQYNQTLIIDINSLSLGISTAGGVMRVLIPRDTCIPTKAQQVCTNYSYNGIVIRVFEGERPFTKDNIELGKFYIQGMRPAPLGVLQIQIRFEIDENGILNVSAKDKEMIRNSGLIVNSNFRRLSEKKISQSIKKLEEHRNQDDLAKKKREARDVLRSYLIKVKYSLAEVKQNNKLQGCEQQDLDSKLKLVEQWLQQHKDAEVQEYQNNRKDLETIFNPIMFESQEKQISHSKNVESKIIQKINKLEPDETD